MNKKVLGWILLAIGAGVIAYFVQQVGPGRFLTAIKTAGWGLIALLALPLFLFFVHAVGWSHTLSRENREKIGLFRLTLLQIFSYGLSGVQPLQFIVAEPLKLAFLKGTDHDKDDFTASLLVDNTINGMAIAAVGASGLIYLAVALVSGLWVKLVIAGLLALFCVIFAAAIILQKRGVFTGVLNLLGRLGPFAAFRERHIEQTERIDERVRAFYNGNRRGFWIAFSCHVLEKAQGVAEFWLIFHLLEMDLSVGASFFVFSVAQTLENLLFFAQIGGMEAWVSSTLAWMNVTQESINITAALFRRVRFLFWGLVALALVGIIRRMFAADRGAKGEG